MTMGVTDRGTDRAGARANAIAWSMAVLVDDNTRLVDVESSGLDEQAEICSIAILDRHGRVLLDALVRPGQPIPDAATRVHGLTDACVAHAVPWPTLAPVVHYLLHGRMLVAYNAPFDGRMLRQTCARHNTVMPRCTLACVMDAWMRYTGSSKWLKLPGAEHGASADVRAMLELIHTMAETKEGEL